ncbi:MULTISPECIES: alpha/beta fold hydrolase [unclassified Streptomyces]
MSSSERTVTRDGVRQACRDWGGPGQPVILLHDWRARPVNGTRWPGP